MSEVAICFFSATGNGYFIATEMKKYMQGDLFYIPQIIGKDLSEYKKIIIITPIYMFAIPNIMKTFIREMPKPMYDANVYIVFNYAGIAGDASYYMKQLFANKGVNIRATYKIGMPLTYTLFMGELQLVAKRLLIESPQKVKKIAMRINADEEKIIKSNCLSCLSKLHDKFCWKYGSFAREKFYVTDSCNECGYCKKICPVGNIDIENGKIIFEEKCISCFACYHRCPTMAINAGKRTIGRKRYLNPYVNIDEMYK